MPRLPIANALQRTHATPVCAPPTVARVRNTMLVHCIAANRTRQTCPVFLHVERWSSEPLSNKCSQAEAEHGDPKPKIVSSLPPARACSKVLRPCLLCSKIANWRAVYQSVAGATLIECEHSLPTCLCDDNHVTKSCQPNLRTAAMCMDVNPHGRRPMREAAQTNNHTRRI